MNEGAIFLVGIIVFAITIYGVVMAGGLALARVVAEEAPQQPQADGGRPASGI